MNSRGFMTVFLMTLTPLALLLLCVVAALAALLLQWRTSHELCQSRLLSAQRTAARQINDLFSLNPEATLLRLELAAAQAALAASPAGGPPAVAAAQAHLDDVLLRQTAFRGKQEWLKARAVIDPSMDLIKAQGEIATLAGIEAPGFSNAHLFVRARPAFSGSPDYVPLQNFSKLQALKGRWTLAPARIFPEWLRSKLPKLANVRGTCSATLVQEGSQWNATLGEGKSSSNF
ncbi:MAG: hypothetical protein ABL958_17305 [Bdellovibrionia bacterium]